MADQSVYAGARPLWMSLPGVNALVAALDESPDNLRGGSLGVPQEAIDAAAAPPGVRFAPNDGPQPQGKAPFDIEAFLAKYGPKLGAGGMGGAGISFAGVDAAAKEDRTRALDLLARIQSGRTAQGALEANRPLTEAFDALAVDKRLRAENPDRRPDNTNYWRAQAMPRWVGGTAGFSIPDTSRAAQLMSDIDKRSEDTREARLAKLLGMEREGVANKNMTAKELHDRVLAPILAQIPNAAEIGLAKDLSKSDLERAKLSAKAQISAASAGRDTQVEERLKMAAQLLRAGKIGEDEYLGLMKGMAFGTPKEIKVEPKMVEEARTSVMNMLGKNANTPTGEIILRDFQQNVLRDPVGAVEMARRQMDSVGKK